MIEEVFLIRVPEGTLCCSRMSKSANCSASKMPPRSLSPTPKLTVPSPPLNRVTKHHTYMVFEHCQGWWFDKDIKCFNCSGAKEKGHTNIVLSNSITREGKTGRLFSPSYISVFSSLSLTLFNHFLSSIALLLCLERGHISEIHVDKVIEYT